MPTSPPTATMSKPGSSLKPIVLAGYPLSGNVSATDFTTLKTSSSLTTAPASAPSPSSRTRLIASAPWP